MEMLAADMLAALTLQVEWGADEALEAAPVNRVAAPVRVTESAVWKTAAMTPVLARPGPGLAVRAQMAAAAANTIEALRQALASFNDCSLATTATSLVFGEGNPAAGLVLVGEAPGAEEDRVGRPFVGDSGAFLDRMFASVGLTRGEMLLTNVIPWRPPGGRPPTDAEVQICLPFLLRHLTLLRPRIVVTLGQLPARALTGRDDGVRKLRGKRLELQVPGLPAPIPVLPMMHPAYVLQTHSAKKDAWADLITLRKALNAL